MPRRNNNQISIAEFPIPETTPYERRVIADIIASPEVITDARGILAPEMFSDDDCRGAYTTLMAMADKAERIDFVTASNRIGHDFVMQNIMPLAAEAGGVTAPIAHMAVLREKHIRRKVYFATIELLRAANSPDNNAEDLVALGQAYIENIKKSAGQKNGMQTLADALNTLGDQIQQIQEARSSGQSVRVTTGFSRLDFLTYGGFGPGNLVILAARPSVGKTATMLQMARSAARSGKVVNIFSLEMTNTELAQRLLLSTGCVQPVELAGGQVEWSDFEAAVSSIERMPMLLNDSAYTLDEIVSHITLNRQNGKCDVAFIDYLGLISTPGDKPQYQMLGDITHRLKATAKKLGIPVVLLCQLNRAIEQTNRAPQLHDLRDSGDIEQDADIVLMLERPTDYDDKRIKMHLRKNRQGVRDYCLHLLPDDSFTRFTEIPE